MINLSEKGYGLRSSNPYGIMMPIEEARFEAIVNEIQELKRRIAELESKK